MSSATTQPATDIVNDAVPHSPGQRHPRWCDRRNCVCGENGARHTSTPTRLVTGEQTFALTLIQHDPGDPELLIEVTDTADPDGLQVLALPEIKAFAEILLIEYLKGAPSMGALRERA